LEDYDYARDLFGENKYKESLAIFIKILNNSEKPSLPVDIYFYILEITRELGETCLYVEYSTRLLVLYQQHKDSYSRNLLLNVLPQDLDTYSGKMDFPADFFHKTIDFYLQIGHLGTAQFLLRQILNLLLQRKNTDFALRLIRSFGSIFKNTSWIEEIFFYELQFLLYKNDDQNLDTFVEKIFSSSSFSNYFLNQIKTREIKSYVLNSYSDDSVGYGIRILLIFILLKEIIESEGVDTGNILLNNYFELLTETVILYPKKTSLAQLYALYFLVKNEEGQLIKLDQYLQHNNLSYTWSTFWIEEVKRKIAANNDQKIDKKEQFPHWIFKEEMKLKKIMFAFQSVGEEQAFDQEGNFQSPKKQVDSLKEDLSPLLRKMILSPLISKNREWLVVLRFLEAYQLAIEYLEELISLEKENGGDDYEICLLLFQQAEMNFHLKNFNQVLSSLLLLKKKNIYNEHEMKCILYLEAETLYNLGDRVGAKACFKELMTSYGDFRLVYERLKDLEKGQ
jgi:hypothetical protein